MPNVAITEENVTPVVEEAVKPAKKAPRAKNRPDAEIMQLGTNKLTEKEKDRVIALLKEELDILKNKADMLQMNCKSAYEQARQLETQYNSMETFYRQKLQFLYSQSKAFMEVVTEVTKGGIN